MAGTTLLVHDDIAAIATLRRWLTRQGHQVVLATTIADAITAFEHHAPSLLMVSPVVEGRRGMAFLEELVALPNGPSTPLLLLGEGLPNVDAPVVTFPIDKDMLMAEVHRALDSSPVWAFFGNQSLDLPADLPGEEPTHPEPPPFELEVDQEDTGETWQMGGATSEYAVPENEEPLDVLERARALETEEAEARARAARLARSAGTAKEAVSRAVRLSQMLQKKQQEELQASLALEAAQAEEAPSAVAETPGWVDAVERQPVQILEAPETPPLLVPAPVEAPVALAPPPAGEVPPPVLVQSLPVAPTLPVAESLDVLDKVYERLLEVDYFEILGLSRQVDTEQVQRAFEHLSATYHPLKYVGHPDGAVRLRVEQIHELLVEAVVALSDEPLRVAYALHLP